MFQFPGFALKDPCIQSLSTWLYPLLSAPKNNNNEHSGGFPHSEIHGSKLILSSPWLIAEYHVFHRLLLPRHPPNALLALDLIQKKKDWMMSYRFTAWGRSLIHNQRCDKTPVCHGIRAGSIGAFILDQKHTIPLLPLEPALPMSVGPTRRRKNFLHAPFCGGACRYILTNAAWLVYLTWTTLFFSAGRHMIGRGNNRHICSLWT